ncbi:lysophospholipid acyltransferase family protein [Shinella zoogloeoides]|uniref:1-acyl-sn-glycerol-3-phosphate acyltransferase n=1 Tax=Shinella zoogloeoides TaxID=352475 RepID=A0A6N8TH72_SHIZO|nr:lysophospholipid acyltransferase family protein [Shinella zoogloeoides]MXO00490.1 1-acyl-sn-glycerol-3-phosphate acyltransferase [Shinella zoogloeoides]UEX83915.1 1-acyl-sn-glycerol-3-phosphate acyltransferase [Shinella zoogloeoides]
MTTRASLLQRASGAALAGLSRAVTGVRPIWVGVAPSGRQRIYFANHASHGDFILVSTCLRPAERSRTAAVAGSDYWNAGPTRRFIAGRLLRTVLVERNWVERTADPLQVMLAALDAGESLIFFPEGTRNMTEEPLLRFRSGLYNLAVARPDVELVPCWIENMSRVLPKGAVLPVPLLCRVVFGAPVTLGEGEDRKVFLDRARQALLSLAPEKDGTRR